MKESVYVHVGSYECECVHARPVCVHMCMSMLVFAYENVHVREKERMRVCVCIAGKKGMKESMLKREHLRTVK